MNIQCFMLLPVHSIGFFVPVCVFQTLYKHILETSRTLFSILRWFPFGHGVLVEIKTSSPPVSGKDKGVFLRFSDSVHVFLVPLLPLKQSQ